MRYGNWDVILFPKDSAVPIQEFRTACYTTEHQGRQLPTLTCYVASLAAAAPFRISVHSWVTPARPSSLIESGRRSSQKVVFAVQLTVDGNRVFHNFYDATSRWPQEITNEKRTATELPRTNNRRNPLLEFPPFHPHVLSQPSWNARESKGRIKLLLSEQLVGKSNNSAEPDLGVANDLVCFAFQYAPQDVLEQAGISWPIRNPLYLTSESYGAQMSQLLGAQTIAETRAKLSSEQRALSTFPRPSNFEPFARSNTGPPLHSSQFPRPTMGRKTRQSGIWDPSLDDYSVSLDDMSTGSWSTRNVSSRSTIDTQVPDMMYASPIFSQSGDAWNLPNPHNLHWRADEFRKHPQSETGSRPVVVALREDQLGQLIEAMSPPKKSRERDVSGQPLSTGAFKNHTVTQLHSAKIRGANTSAASTARKASYSNLQQNRPAEVFSLDEDLPPAQSGEGPCLLSKPFHAGRFPTSHPFVAPQAQMGRYGSGVSTRNDSAQSGLLRRPQSKEDRTSPTPIPIARESVKSRKEGISLLTTSPSLGNHREQSPLPEVGPNTRPARASAQKPSISIPRASIEGIIDIDAVDDSFVLGHKVGMSSIDSTGQLERKLYSALGEELSFHEDADTMPGVENEAVTAGTDLSDLDLDMPATKRKRQGTLGGESPAAKLLREHTNDDLGKSPSLPRLRGG